MHQYKVLLGSLWSDKRSGFGYSIYRILPRIEKVRNEWEDKVASATLAPERVSGVLTSMDSSTGKIVRR